MPRDLRDLLEYTNNENLERIADALEDIARVLSAPGDVDGRPILERMVIALHHLVTRP